MTHTGAWFVYTETNGKVNAQKWARWWNPLETQMFKVLQKHPITEAETALSITYLKEKYPYAEGGTGPDMAGHAERLPD